jgi:hypothetical protein
MRKQVPIQLVVGLAILVIGGGIVCGEYFLVKWYPGHQAVVKKETLQLLPYKNDSLGIEMQVAAGFYEKVEPFPGGVRIFAPRFWSIGPSVTLTSQPNPDQSAEFTPQILAKWQTQGVVEEIPRYHFERTRLNNRDAVLIWQYKGRAMALTAQIISPDRIVQADCTTGRADEDLYMQACDETLRSIKVAGPESLPPLTPGVMELTPAEQTPPKP